jgi:hypothetical protein
MGRPRKRIVSLGAMLAIAGFVTVIAPSSAGALTKTFSDDGTFAVPVGICRVVINATGGSGGDGSSGVAAGGPGGGVTAAVAVTPGDTLDIVIGREGSNLTPLAVESAGYATGGTSPVGATPTDQGGAGGGATAVTHHGTAVMIAGGGGGGGGGNNAEGDQRGGAGGAAPAGAGGAGSTPTGGGEGGQGGTTTGAGGAPGAGTGVGDPGAPGDAVGDGGGGGNGGPSDVATGGGGGGGFGGGGGGAGATGGGGGGGGSSTAFASEGTTDVSFSTGPTNGDGQVKVVWDPATDACPGTVLPDVSLCGAMTISTNVGHLSGVTPVAVPSSPTPPDGVLFPCGLIGFSVTGLSPGASTTITVDFGFEPSSYWKLQDGWFELESVIDGNEVSFTLTDGGIGDSDDAANGTIVDPSGPAIATSPLVVVRPTFTG